MVGSAAGAPDEKADVVEVVAFTAPFRELEIASETGGVLTEVHVDEGDEVERGRVLVELKSDVLRARLAVSQARTALAALQIRARQTTSESCENEFQRCARMLGQGLLDDQRFQRAKLERDIAELNVEAAELEKRVYELEALQDRAELNQAIVRAPTDGQVFRVLKRAGEAVERHAPVLSIVCIDPLYVVTNAPISTAGRIRVGMKARLRLESLRAQPLECTVAVVDRVADAASGTYRVKLSLPNPGKRITAGAKGAVTFKLTEQANGVR
jgi:RND family efflux transporter MFP subunit